MGKTKYTTIDEMIEIPVLQAISIGKAGTPTLIQHGDKDNRVPVSNAFELYRALQDLKVESELVIFKDMAHSPQKPGIHKAIMEQNLGWFMEHIK